MPESQSIKNMNEINSPEDHSSASDSQSHKKVDEKWKENVEKEKAAPKEKSAFVPPAPDFKFFVTTLAMQASIALGHMPNPLTDKVEEDLIQAKFLIDTLGMLKEKTSNNLSNEETELLENLLYELRVAYLEKEKGKAK